ncbi:hypothetical protein H6F86_20480 [Phormidium sp. FACHB-592]|uniref:Uncharacterized protein n=1 Tax=Stenomitos frigidus AS-A4 TaxID=2933935 RepID=A0ABV0KH00_9CYAN|nr:hypothetical protein [Phormidium sp. FACHB-592]MBD2076209.1 hypothetical protein [Phormidium sp. FACHB-592]
MPVTTHIDLLDGQLYFPGQEITTQGSSISSILTGFNNTGAIIPFGFGVCQGATPDLLTLPTDANSIFRGVNRQMDIEKRSGYSLDGSGRFGIPNFHELAFLEAGDIAVYIDGDIVQGSPVYLNHTATSSVVGAFRGAANGGSATLIAGAYWLKTVTGATAAAMKVAPLRLNRP